MWNEEDREISSQNDHKIEISKKKTQRKTEDEMGGSSHEGFEKHNDEVEWEYMEQVLICN